MPSIESYRDSISKTPASEIKQGMISLGSALDELDAKMEELGRDTPGLETFKKELQRARNIVDDPSSSESLGLGDVDLKAKDEARAKVKKNMERSLDGVVSMMRRLLMQVMRQAFRDAIEFAKEYSAALNEIRVVTLKTQEEAERLGDSYIRIAREMKLTSTEVARTAVELYRQGINDNEVNKRLRHIAQFAKVAGISMSDAMDTVTVSINTGLVESAQRATDVLTALGDAAATDSLLAA